MIASKTLDVTDYRCPRCDRTVDGLSESVRNATTNVPRFCCNCGCQVFQKVSDRCVPGVIVKYFDDDECTVQIELIDSFDPDETELEFALFDEVEPEEVEQVAESVGEREIRRMQGWEHMFSQETYV